MNRHYFLLGDSHLDWILPFLLGAVLIFSGCFKESQPPLFNRIPSQKSNVLFSNNVLETDSFNILSHEFMYNGGGVGVGDFNQDGLFDLYFSGNQVGNKLYLNTGNFIFRDVTDIAGVGAEDIWSSGVAIVDINHDGLADIYVSATFEKEINKRTNKLFINKGNDANGIPSFTEEAENMGLADTSYTTQTYFFDYDKDGDLDAFLLNDKLFRPRSTTDLKLLMSGGEATIDKLLENKGNLKFEDVSKEAGIAFPGFGLGAAIFDINDDGFLDIYVSNDFISNDFLYVNQGDGTFKNEVSKYFKHHSFSSMGIDASDLNEDGIADVMTLDMLPADKSRVKKTYAFHKYQFYDLMKETGYAMQYNRNTLHISNRNGQYSEIAELAGVDATEWSWSTLLSDFDNDGLKDIAITNGYPRDITDMDFTDYNSGIESMMDSKSKLLSQIPVVKVHNYVFKNSGNYKFEDKSAQWGFTELSFSNGAVTVDLDNDGDLDYVVNNINDEAFIYENKTNDISNNKFLRIQIEGDSLNTFGIGTTVTVYQKERKTTITQMPQRGYLSSIEPVLHFGLGNTNHVDSVKLIWPDGGKLILKDIELNQLLTVKKVVKGSDIKSHYSINSRTLFENLGSGSFDFKHGEVNFYDYKFQGLLQRLHSREGPGLAVGDLNGDDIDDLIFGNGSREQTHVYLSAPGNTYVKKLLNDISLSEDMGILVFDADNDGDNDLYIVSGSTEFRKGSGYYQDKFYRNDGNGNLTFEPDFLPKFSSSGASVSGADFDRDGDTDLFVAGRISPQNYPNYVSSHLLINEKGTYVMGDTTSASLFHDLGLVTQGLWTDMNNDGWQDLIVVGEWMPVKIFINDKGKLSKPIELQHSSGWWNSITGADLDGDGDIDYVVGNQGLNNKHKPLPGHPLMIYAHDFDQNGSIDPVMVAYHNDGYYPVHLKMDLLNQLNFLKKNFNKYAAYADAKIDDLITPDTLRHARKYVAEMFESIILWNDNGDFRMEPLPIEAQFAPVYGSICIDIELDGDEDILLVGNRYNTEVFEGQHDALNGVILENNGQGEFRSLPISKSGFNVKGDARAIVNYFDSNNNSHIMVSTNNDSISIYKLNHANETEVFDFLKNEVRVTIAYRNGQSIVKEKYMGSSFLSQSGQRFLIDPMKVKKIEFLDTYGSVRTVTY